MTEEKEISEEVEAPVAAEHESTGEETNQDAADTTSNQKSHWARARDTMAEQSSQIKSLRAELENMRASQSVTPQQQQKAQSLFDGRDEDDILTVSDLKRALSEKEREYQQQIAELSVKSTYSDYNKVVEKYGKTLPDAVKQAIVHAPNPYEALYEACKDSGAYYKDQLMSEKHVDAKKASDNLSKPGSASSVGGAGALSKASLYEGMSDSDIIAMSEKFIRG